MSTGYSREHERADLAFEREARLLVIGMGSDELCEDTVALRMHRLIDLMNWARTCGIAEGRKRERECSR
jgi:hypothetical protein